MLAQAVGFFGAGQDPVSTLMSLALYELAVNKDIQGRTREEITTLFKKHGEISYECMQEMKYLDMICQGKYLFLLSVDIKTVYSPRRNKLPMCGI